MPKPVSPITLLYEALKATTALNGVNVLLSAKRIAEGRAPNTIILYPTDGDLINAADTSALRDTNLRFVARCWGDDYDEAWYLATRLMQALDEQASAEDADGDGNEDGSFWVTSSISFNADDQDSNRQGEECALIFVPRFAFDKVTEQLGEVDATSFNRLAKLTGAMAPNDVAATVPSTFMYPPSGVLHIGDEDIGYAALTDTQFTGLTRGLNGTTPAAHAVGARVSVTPS
jgi:hypothetical protein